MKATSLLPLLMIGLGFVSSTGAGEMPIRFKDVTGVSGIRFQHTDGSSGRHYIVETVTCGLGLIDFDNDGWPDILFLNGGPLPGCASFPAPPTSGLYRNNRDGTFTDVTVGSGLDVPGYGMGCAVADYDNDGNEDVFITNYGTHRLFRNLGNGKFEDVTIKAGLGGASYPGCVGAGPVFLDYDRDGNVDLFVGNYLEFHPETAAPKMHGSVQMYHGPRTFPPGRNKLFKNNGDGTFKDVTDASGIGKYRGYAMGVVSADFDLDGWPDLYVGNDVIENHLFRNKRDGTFEEIGTAAGAAYDQYGDPQGTMGSNVGDYDGDGLFDILVTDYQDQVTTLYRNLGRWQFQDVTVQTGTGAGSRRLVTWGCGLVDFDNDGTLELFTAAGHLQDTIEQYDRTTTYKQGSILMKQRQGRFEDITGSSGALAELRESSRGAVFGDLNNDGKLDIVILNARSRPSVLMNDTLSANHWVTLKLKGTRSNRSAVGAVVRVTAGGRTQVDEVRAGRGYQSAEDLRLHFGVGGAGAIERLEVRWPGGSTNSWTNVACDRIVAVVEGDNAKPGQ